MLKNENNVTVDTSIPTEMYPAKTIKLDKTETVIISRPANHNEISIMETTWNQIQQKVEKIDPKTSIDVFSILVGALIPYLIELITSLYKHEPLNCFPAVIYLLFFFAYTVLIRLGFFSHSTADANKIHLNDIKELINSATKSNDKSN